MPYLLVNFGGPRNLEEISPFLVTLLCDRDVIRTRFPSFLHNLLFRNIARKRAIKVAEDYELIGGFSPIYFDTENLALALSQKLKAPVLTFHRYLPATHQTSLKKINEYSEIIVIPLFPQFCYATTGSIARFFSHHVNTRLRWIKSYATHPAFIKAYQTRIALFLQEHGLKEEETTLLFSAHGVPRQFIDEGDIYELECQHSYHAIMEQFPKALGRLCYQSKFGKGEWLRPYTNEACEQLLSWNEGKKNTVFVPISFTTDHIETLFEIEKLYLPLIGSNAYRCPALNLEPYWIEGLSCIAQEKNYCNNEMLIR